RGRETVAKANVLAANVNVDETTDRAVFFAEAVLQARKGLPELVDTLGHGAGAGPHFPLSLGQPPQGRRDLDDNLHDFLLVSTTGPSRAARKRSATTRGSWILTTYPSIRSPSTGSTRTPASIVHSRARRISSSGPSSS